MSETKCTCCDKFRAENAALVRVLEEIQAAGHRHVPLFFGARVEQRLAMGARCWTICETCGVDMHRADGEPWTAYVAPVSTQEGTR